MRGESSNPLKEVANDHGGKSGSGDPNPPSGGSNNAPTGDPNLPNPPSGSVVNVNNEPTLAKSIDDKFTDEDEGFVFTLDSDTFIDTDGDPLTYTATLADGTTALPAWLSFDTDTGTFSGKPDNNDVGIIDVKVTASDGESSVFDEFSISVLNVINPITTNGNVFSGTAGDDIIKFNNNGIGITRGNGGKDTFFILVLLVVMGIIALRFMIFKLVQVLRLIY